MRDLNIDTTCSRIPVAAYQPESEVVERSCAAPDRRRVLHMRRWRQALVALVLTLSGTTAHATQYIYDALGRLVEVIATNGTTITYSYDAAGNITSIRQLATGQLAISEVSPDKGLVGDSITIGGDGFSTTPANDLVKFNGAVATVVSATATQLVAKVPSGASSGSVTVTVGSSTATSPQSFTVLVPPTITGFSPATVNPSQSVAITGANIDPVAGATSILVGIEAAVRSPPLARRRP